MLSLFRKKQRKDTSPYATASEYELWNGCVQQDIHAWDELYRRYASLIYAICLRYAGNEVEAQDFLQEVFLRLVEKLPGWKQKGSLERWIRRVAVRVCLNQLRKKHPVRTFSELEKIYGTRTRPSGGGEEDDTPRMEELLPDTSSPPVLEELSTADLIRMIQQLPPRYRVVFNLHVIEGYSYTEISRMLGIPESTCRSLVHRARKQLAEKIARYMPDALPSSQSATTTAGAPFWKGKIPPEA